MIQRKTMIAMVVAHCHHLLDKLGLGHDLKLPTPSDIFRPHPDANGLSCWSALKQEQLERSITRAPVYSWGIIVKRWRMWCPWSQPLAVTNEQGRWNIRVGIIYLSVCHEFISKSATVFKSQWNGVWSWGRWTYFGGCLATFAGQSVHCFSQFALLSIWFVDFSR